MVDIPAQARIRLLASLRQLRQTPLSKQDPVYALQRVIGLDHVRAASVNGYLKPGKPMMNGVAVIEADEELPQSVSRKGRRDFCSSLKVANMRVKLQAAQLNGLQDSWQIVFAGIGKTSRSIVLTPKNPPQNEVLPLPYFSGQFGTPTETREFTAFFLREKDERPIKLSLTWPRDVSRGTMAHLLHRANDFLTHVFQQVTLRKAPTSYGMEVDGIDGMSGRVYGRADVHDQKISFRFGVRQ